MKRIYSALNLPDAQIISDLLTQSGIRTRIFNQNAAGALGELPVDAAQPQVWVEDERREVEARQLVEQFHRANIRSAQWACRECGEGNPSTFEICWNCGLAAC